MSKLKSTNVDRACHILVYMVDKYLAHSSSIDVSHGVTVPELVKVCEVSKPVIYVAVNMLIEWGHIKNVKDGRKSEYFLTDKGFSWVESHEGYCVQRSEINKAVIYANKTR